MVHMQSNPLTGIDIIHYLSKPEKNYLFYAFVYMYLKVLITVFPKQTIFKSSNNYRELF